MEDGSIIIVPYIPPTINKVVEADSKEEIFMGCNTEPIPLTASLDLLSPEMHMIKVPKQRKATKRCVTNEDNMQHSKRIRRTVLPLNVTNMKGDSRGGSLTTAEKLQRYDAIRDGPTPENLFFTRF
jgi:hypothetical protein